MGKKIFIGILAALAIVLVAAAIIVSRREREPELPPFPAVELDEDGLMLITGKIVTQNVGTFGRGDGDFMNLLSLQDYVTSGLYRRFEEIAGGGQEESPPGHEQVTTVSGQALLSKTASAASARYDAAIVRSDQPGSRSANYTVSFEKVNGIWLVSDTSQIQR